MSRQVTQYCSTTREKGLFPAQHLKRHDPECPRAKWPPPKQDSHIGTSNLPTQAVLGDLVRPAPKEFLLLVSPENLQAFLVGGIEWRYGTVARETLGSTSLAMVARARQRNALTRVQNRQQVVLIVSNIPRVVS